MAATAEQIVNVIRAMAQLMGRAPTSTELRRSGGISPAQVKHRFQNHMAALRAAGLEVTATRTRASDAELLTDWGEVTRELKGAPTKAEYASKGRHTEACLIRHFARWTLVPAAFIKAVRRGELAGEWGDVLEMIRKGPIPVRGGGRWMKELREAVRRGEKHPAVAAKVESEPRRTMPALPTSLLGKRCVTATMLLVIFAGPQVTGFVRRVLPDRPLLGAPMNLPGLAYEPVNEMGVSMLFAMLADRLGFIIESVQAAFPDCRAKMEVMPGRWQDVRIEFEYESRSFRDHRHDPRKCDLIVCWKHNWKECPAELQVLELSKVIGRLGHRVIG